MASFKGIGMAWIPSKHRAVRFVDGIYSTDDSDEIAVLTGQFERIDSAPVMEHESEDRPKRGRPRNV